MRRVIRSQVVAREAQCTSSFGVQQPVRVSPFAFGSLMFAK